MEYDPTQFRGTAPFYLRGRPPYSAELAEVLQRELQLDGHGRLLDVGSGPGTIGVQLAPLFEQVIFVEPDPDMLTEARAHAASALLRAADFHAQPQRTSVLSSRRLRGWRHSDSRSIARIGCA